MIGSSLISPLHLPDGFSARPVGMDDIPMEVQLFNAQSQMLLGQNHHSAEDLRMEWSDAQFNLATDTQSVWTMDGQMVAYVEFFDSNELHVRMMCWAAVHPDFLGRGLGSALNDWAVARARQNVPLAVEGARVVLHGFVISTDARSIALYEAKGFHHERSFFRMRIDFDQPCQPVPQTIDGIEIRPVQPGQERIAIYTAYDAFRDHWGFIEEPFESYYEHQMHYNTPDNPYYDPTLWLLAWDGDEVAGVSICAPYILEEPSLGWVSKLGVRRGWRKRGLGKALLQHSFAALQARGRTSIGLGVDASSLTGALRLYENAGMHAYEQTNLYELELRPGRALLKQSVD